MLSLRAQKPKFPLALADLLCLSALYLSFIILKMMASYPEPEVNVSLGTLSPKHLIG